MATKFKLRSCVWEITLACCFSCKYCGSKGGTARGNELSTDECKRIAKELSSEGCKRVNLIGGEVFMRKDWKEIASTITSLGMKLCIISNGFLFDEKLLNNLKEINIESVAVSLDGPMDVHDKYRQDGSFERAVAAIKALSGAGIPVSVISTLNSENVKRLHEFYEFLKSFNIFAWQLQACSPMGNAAKGNIDVAFDFQEVIDFVNSNMYDAPFNMGIADNIGYYSPEEGSLRGNRSGEAFFTGCSAGLNSIGIDSIGNVRGCESMYDDSFIEGNLREKSLHDIWNDENAFAYNRGFKPEMLTGGCVSCSEKLRCAGGCRSYNYFTHGKLYESLRCVRNKK